MERLLDRNRPSYRHVVATKKKIQPILETDVDDSAVAERVKISLEGCDMTTREVADAVGVGEKVIYSWGRLGQISKHKLPAFCQVTNVDIDWLLTGRTSGMTYERTANESIVEFRRSRGVGNQSSVSAISPSWTHSTSTVCCLRKKHQTTLPMLGTS